MTTPWVVAFVVLWAFVVLLALLVLGSLRQVGSLLERAEAGLAAAARSLIRAGLAPGTKVPPFAAEIIDGSRFTEADLHGTRTVVLFLDSACQSCGQFVHDLTTGYVPSLDAQLVVVSDDRGEAARWAAEGVTVLVQEDRSLAQIFESDRTPHAFVVDENGRVILRGTPNDWDLLRDLARSTEEGGGQEPKVPAAVAAS